MSKLTIRKNEQGKLEGLDPVGQRSYLKFKCAVDALEVGQTIGFSYRLPRSPSHHKLFFAQLQSLLSRTETFTELDNLRYWIILGAGYADFVPGLDGMPNAIPRSMDYESMDEAEFSELHHAMHNFLWTARAQAILWPAADNETRYRCVESFVEEFAQ